MQSSATSAPGSCGTLALGETAECAVEPTGAVRCVGTFDYELGSTATHAAQPTGAPGLAKIDQLSVGYAHGCARSGDAVSCWGYGELGQLGGPALKSSPKPVAVKIDPIAEIEVGHVSSCARSHKGDVWCWGMIGTSPGSWDARPVRIALAHRAIDLDMGYSDGCAVLDDGGVQCWNEATKIRSISGLPPARQVVVGWVDQPRACAVTETREVWCWELAWKKDPKVSAHKLDLAKPVVQVVAGSGHLCALTDAGEVLCWGALGAPGACTGSLRTTRGRDAPAQIATSSPSPRQLAFPSPIETLYAGQSIVCGQSSAGDVYCQGCRASGEALATPKLLPMSVARCRGPGSGHR